MVVIPNYSQSIVGLCIQHPSLSHLHYKLPYFLRRIHLTSNQTHWYTNRQGCINCGILLSGIRARGVSSEHMENMEMFSCSPTQVRSDSQRTQSDIHCMFVLGKSKTISFPSNTLIYGISRDGSKNFNLRTWEHMILGQLRIGARSTTYAALAKE